MQPDLGLVDALARLKLAARRLGCSMRVCEPSVELAELLDLVGLNLDLEAEPIGEVSNEHSGGVSAPQEPKRRLWRAEAEPTHATSSQVVGETEGGEQVGVEEAVERGDPVT